MHSPTATRRGFTLVELLVVIAIVGILASLITVAASSAVIGAKQTRVKAELDQIAAAFKAYKVKYGSYPPNFNDGLAVKRHLLKAFPRIKEDLDALFITSSLADRPNAAEAVVFWLSGFSANPQYPLTGPGGPLSANPGTSTPLFEFDETRLSNPADPSHLPRSVTIGSYTFSLYKYRPYGADLGEPFVYFDVSRLNPLDSPPSYSGASSNGSVHPYKSTSGKYVDGDAFQVLAAGLDNHWGDGSKTNYPEGPYLGNEADNLASFSTKNMEDSMP